MTKDKRLSGKFFENWKILNLTTLEGKRNNREMSGFIYFKIITIKKVDIIYICRTKIGSSLDYLSRKTEGKAL